MAYVEQFISSKEAAAKCGRSLTGFWAWLRRFEKAHPETEIRRLRGRVHAGDLQEALNLATAEFRKRRLSPGVALRE